MALLLDNDYARLKELEILYEEDLGTRSLVLRNWALLTDLYTVSRCDVLVVIPENYPDDGNDMLWTSPMLVRKDGKAIPALSGPGAGENRKYGGSEFSRWSRHWNTASTKWRAGKDDVDSILRRLHWALENPDADRP
ncbi:MAG: E2/UBC family protein [Deltaproteobacteria bacterium]|nr:E2/UBC family protein [Deltaproteobacteria bacterium]